MIRTRLAPTRSQLLKSRRRLDRVHRGIELLTRKRQALVKDLFRLANPAIEAQTRVAGLTRQACDALLAAIGMSGTQELEAQGWPIRRVEAEVTPIETWGVVSGSVESLDRVQRTAAARGLAPGATGPAATAAADHFERLVELLLDAASTELLLRRLADALARTTRQVNTLDRRVAPELAREIARVRQLLEEREREDHARLKRLIATR